MSTIWRKLRVKIDVLKHHYGPNYVSREAQTPQIPRDIHTAATHTQDEP